MKIALFYHGVLPVRGYGGTERVVVWLVRGLAELGHQVTLIAGPGSRVPEARLVPVDPGRAERAEFDVRPFLPPGTEVLHAHRPYQPLAEVPTLWTLHGNARSGRSYPKNRVCLSAEHAARHGTDAFVYNGLDVAEYRFEPRKGDFDLFLGRLHSIKGWHWAVEGARRTGHQLVVAGGWRPSIRRGLRFVGTVDGPRKRDLLAEAACLWMPVLWDEPFGLTSIEAMASGTPVLATRRGALPEVVGRTGGALGTTLEELIALRAGLGAVSPEACRTRVERWFSHRVMAEEYVRCYRQLAASGTLPAGRPVSPDPP